MLIWIGWGRQAAGQLVYPKRMSAVPTAGASELESPDGDTFQGNLEDSHNSWPCSVKA